MTSLVRSKRLESLRGKVTKRGKCAIGGYHDGRPVNLFFVLYFFIIQCILIGFCVLHASLRPAWAMIGLHFSKLHGVLLSNPALVLPARSGVFCRMFAKKCNANQS